MRRTGRSERCSSACCGPPSASLKAQTLPAEETNHGQVVETGTKVCPYCSERVRAEAVKCRFCGEWFQDRTQAARAAELECS
jgi:hypothetical protein